MRYLFNEISKLRNKKPIWNDKININRYRICVCEADGSHTSYCTSVPICEKETGKPVQQSFKSYGLSSCLVGSNAVITINDNIHMSNENGDCCIHFDRKPLYRSENMIKYEDIYIYPTSNGITCKVKASKKEAFNFILSSKTLFFDIRANKKYFSLMSAKFKPLVTASAIGALDSKDRFISPSFINYVRLQDGSYKISLSTGNKDTEYILFEINMHDEKLIQDTTVESRDPKINNAFGSVAFIGNTMSYGDQWLYSRPDFSKIPELFDVKIKSATVHYPKYDTGNVALAAFRISSRFCSFGSNWANKVGYSSIVSDSRVSSDYHSINMTELLCDPYTGLISHTEGWVLKTKFKVSDFTAISTGDCHFAPVIIEINHT